MFLPMAIVVTLVGFASLLGIEIGVAHAMGWL